MKELSIKLEEREGVLTATIDGSITEAADFSAVLNRAIQGQIIQFDLAQVARINSWGVQKWLAMVTQLSQKKTPFSLQRCSVPIVHHFNTMSGFSGDGRIESVYIPFYCEGCDKAHDELVSIEKMGHLPEFPDIECPSCGMSMVFDDIPEVYFRFLCGSEPEEEHPTPSTLAAALQESGRGDD